MCVFIINGFTGQRLHAAFWEEDTYFPLNCNYFIISLTVQTNGKYRCVYVCVCVSKKERVSKRESENMEEAQVEAHAESLL